MAFVNSGLLWLLLPLGLIPIVIYYLMRFRSLKVTWGANYVLERALDRLRKKLYWDQLILLALRVLACIALVLAFARPVVQQDTLTTSSSGVHRIVVVDNSYSMGASDGDRSRWQIGLDMLNSLVGTWGRGERWSLYVLGAESGWVVRDGRVATPEQTQAEIAKLALTEERVALTPALEAILDLYTGEKIELYILADEQADTWRDADGIASPSPAVPTYWLCPPLESRANVAVTGLELSHRRVVQGHPCRVYVDVRSYAEEPLDDIGVEFLVDGSFFGKETVSLLPGQASRLHLDVVFETPGSHAVTARLDRDPLLSDNQMSAGVDVVDMLRVLVLQDAAKGKKFDSAFGFMDLAAQIMEREDDDGARLSTKGVLKVAKHEGDVALADLTAHDVVIVDGGSPVAQALADTLRAYADQGGGVLLAPDDGVDIKQWNEVFGTVGLLPAPLTRARVLPLGGDGAQQLSRSGFTAPAMRSFETLDDGDLENLRFYSWLEFGEPNANSTVLATFAGGAPFLLESRRESGAVMLLAAGLNGRSNNLIVRELYYPLVMHLTSQAAAGAIFPRTVARGDAIRYRYDADDEVKALTFNLEGKEATPLTSRAVDDALVAELPDGSERSGIGSVLVIRDSGTERVWFGIQGQRTDSDLTPWAEEQRAAFDGAWAVNTASSWDQLHELLKAANRGAEQHHWAAMALLLFLIGEMFLQRRFL